MLTHSSITDCIQLLYLTLLLNNTPVKFIVGLSVSGIVAVMVRFGLSFEFTITIHSAVLADTLFTLYEQRSVLDLSTLQLNVVSYGSEMER